MLGKWACWTKICGSSKLCKLKRPEHFPFLDALMCSAISEREQIIKSNYYKVRMIFKWHSIIYSRKPRIIIIMIHPTWKSPTGSVTTTGLSGSGHLASISTQKCKFEGTDQTSTVRTYLKSNKILYQDERAVFPSSWTVTEIRKSFLAKPIQILGEGDSLLGHRAWA